MRGQGRAVSPAAERGRKPSLDLSNSSGRLPQNRAELPAIAEALSDPIVGALDGTIHTWNAGAERLFGYAAHEVIGMPVGILYPPDRLGELEDIMRCLGRGEAVEQFDTVRRRKDGTDVQVSLSLSPVRTQSGELVGAAIVHDISDRKRLADFQRFLVEASRLLAVSLDYRKALSRVAHLTSSELADWCLIEAPDATTGSLSQVAAAHREPAKAALAAEMRHQYPPTATRPDISLRVLATGKAELIPNVSDVLLENIAQSVDHLGMLRALDLRSLVVVPMRVGERTLGTILLARTRPGRPFNSEDLELAEDLGRRAALAIDNFVLHRSEQEARRGAEKAVMRITGLQAVTAALLQAVTPRAVAEVFVRQGAAAVGASGGFVRLLTDDGRTLRLEATVGYSDQFKHSYKTLPLASALPGAEVFRVDGERYFESAAAAEAASPEFAREQAATGHEAIAFLPLRTGDRPIGLMAMSFLNSRTFDDDDRELLRTLASQCSQALERARLYEGERSARATAEVAIEQTTRLQSLAAALAEALTPEQVAEVVVAHGVASLRADAGAFQLLSDDGRMLEVIYEHGPESGLIDASWRRFPVDVKSPSTDALHGLEPLFIESGKELRDGYGYLPGTRAAPQPRAEIHIPLVVFGRAIGVLYLGFANPRRFSESERSFVLGLGRQCAQALKRAQLYGAELEGRTRLTRLVERLHEGVVSVDRGGRVEFASSAAKRMLSSVALEEGRSVPESWLGFPLRGFVARLFEDEGRAVEVQFASRDGARVFQLTGIPAERTDAALLVINDVSERERRQRVEREFIDNAAHELRTPLAAITSAVERLQAGAREVPEKRDRFLGHIQRESSRLNRLASSLLVLARAQTHDEDPRREEIRVAEMIEDSVGDVELKHGVELVLSCPHDLVARSNRDLLEHALLNLTSNAARHTASGRICVRASAADNGSTIIEVSDTGSGIPRDEFGRLFDRFYRGSGEQGRAGFGLGLPITKQAVEALGGRVEIDSVLGEGTTGRIILPGTVAPVPA